MPPYLPDKAAMLVLPWLFSPRVPFDLLESYFVPNPS